MNNIIAKILFGKFPPRVFLYGSPNIKSKPTRTIGRNYGVQIMFYFNLLSNKTFNVHNDCDANYSEDIKSYAEDYQQILKSNNTKEKKDSSIIYDLHWYANNFHRGDFFNSWGVYQKVSKFDILQGKYPYIDFYTAYKKKKRIYRKNDWNRTTHDSIYLYDCSIERYLLVDSVIYLFTSSLLKPHRNRKRGLKIVEREFKQFVRCIWVKEEEDLIE